MSVAFGEEKNFVYTLSFNEIVGGQTLPVSVGRFNGPDLTMGGESDEGIDPEVGTYLMGGRQTGAEITLDRPWKRDRDRAHYTRLYPLRQRVDGTLALLELDDFGNPTRPEPVNTWKVLLTEVGSPPAKAGGNDPGSLTLGVRVLP